MAIPDFQTTIDAFRAWSKRGATLDEIRAAIALQQDGGGGSSGGGASQAEIQAAVAAALAANPSISGLSVGNDTLFVPIDGQWNNNTLPLFAFQANHWIVGFDLVFSIPCLATLVLDGQIIGHYFSVNSVEKTLAYAEPLVGNFELAIAENTGTVRVTGMAILRRTI